MSYIQQGSQGPHGEKGSHGQKGSHGPKGEKVCIHIYHLEFHEMYCMNPESPGEIGPPGEQVVMLQSHLEFHEKYLYIEHNYTYTQKRYIYILLVGITLISITDT